MLWDHHQSLLLALRGAFGCCPGPRLQYEPSHPQGTNKPTGSSEEGGIWAECQNEGCGPPQNTKKRSKEYPPQGITGRSFHVLSLLNAPKQRFTTVEDVKGPQERLAKRAQPCAFTGWFHPNPEGRSLAAARATCLDR